MEFLSQGGKEVGGVGARALLGFAETGTHGASGTLAWISLKAPVGLQPESLEFFRPL